ncbi:MAG: DUF3179 domain-containing protein [Pseudomonadales bacterium]
MSISALAAGNTNDFQIRDPLIPAEQIRHGGPPRDGIPSLDNPSFIKALKNRLLKDNDRILGLTYQGVSKAYPVRILDHHELVNDLFNGYPVLISYCPLCGTGMAFDAKVNGHSLEFGVSGLLYNSDVLMYDRSTESLWSQILQTAISGKMKGQRLNMLPLEHTSWGDWRQRHPNTLLLSFDTGHRRSYKITPYWGYSSSERLYFPISHQDKRYHPKEIIVGISINGVHKAYPFIELKNIQQPLLDTVGNSAIQIHYNPADRSARVLDTNNQLIPSLTAFWFAWYTFHPDTAVFTAESQ